MQARVENQTTVKSFCCVIHGLFALESLLDFVVMKSWKSAKTKLLPEAVMTCCIVTNGNFFIAQIISHSFIIDSPLIYQVMLEIFALLFLQSTVFPWEATLEIFPNIFSFGFYNLHSWDKVAAQTNMSKCNNFQVKNLDFWNSDAWFLVNTSTSHLPKQGS